MRDVRISCARRPSNGDLLPATRRGRLDRAFASSDVLVHQREDVGSRSSDSGVEDPSRCRPLVRLALEKEIEPYDRIGLPPL